MNDNREVNYNLALIEIEKFTKVFRAFDESKNALIALASLDQATKELQNRKELLEKEYSLEKKSFDDWKTSSSKDIEEIVSEYKLKTKQLKDRYENEELKNNKNFILKQEEQNRKISEIDLNIKTKVEELQKLSSIIDSKSKEVVDLERRLAEVKNTISSLIK